MCVFTITILKYLSLFVYINGVTSIVTLHDYRHHSDVKEIYKQRPQHIEKVFADGKMKYGLRYTYFRTKERVHRELTLIYACMNLKKVLLTS